MELTMTNHIHDAISLAKLYPRSCGDPYHMAGTPATIQTQLAQNYTLAQLPVG